MDCICFEISFAYNFNSVHYKYVLRNENFKKLAFISLFTIFIVIKNFKSIYLNVAFLDIEQFYSPVTNWSQLHKISFLSVLRENCN